MSGAARLGRVKPRDSRPVKEWQLHGFIADLLRFNARKDILWIHIPNEGLRAPRTGAFLKRLGMMPGAADFLIVTKGGVARFLEVKTIAGRVSPAQRAFAELALASGASYAIVRKPAEAALILEGWGAIESSFRTECRWLKRDTVSTEGSSI